MRSPVLMAVLLATPGAGMAQDPPPQEGELTVAVRLDRAGERVTLSLANVSRRPLTLAMPQGMPLEMATRRGGHLFLARPVELKLAPGAARTLEVPVIAVGDCPPGDYGPSLEAALAPDVKTVRQFMAKVEAGAMTYDPVTGRLAVLVRRHGLDKGQQLLASQLGPLRAQQHRNVLSAAGLLPGGAAPAPQRLFALNNVDAVIEGPKHLTTLRLAASTRIAQIRTYHWNGGRGAPAGTLALRDAKGRLHGPWKAQGEAGYRGAKDVYWNASPDVVLPAGDYTVVDSSPETWSHNAASGHRGFVEVFGWPAR